MSELSIKGTDGEYKQTSSVKETRSGWGYKRMQKKTSNPWGGEWNTRRDEERREVEVKWEGGLEWSGVVELE
jgi:hypothetical protein